MFSLHPQDSGSFRVPRLPAKATAHAPDPRRSPDPRGRAADLPPAPPAGAPVEERLYLGSAASDGAGLLAARIACVAFQRARLEARLEEGLLARGWSAEADRLWRLSEALARFEAAHIRPLVDEETQSVLLDAYFPDGIAAAPDGPARADRCRAFGEAYMLRRVLG